MRHHWPPRVAGPHSMPHSANFCIWRSASTTHTAYTQKLIRIRARVAGYLTRTDASGWIGSGFGAMYTGRPRTGKPTGIGCVVRAGAGPKPASIASVHSGHSSSTIDDAGSSPLQQTQVAMGLAG